MVVSSAYKIKLRYLVPYRISCQYMRNNNGPRMEPCGTPVDNDVMVEETPSISKN